MGDYSNFYTLDTRLTGLGSRKDISLDAKVKLTDDKKAYQYIVTDQIDDLGYDAQVDNDLFSEVSLVKDNEDYKFSGYYNYLYDMDPGSSKDDLQSRAEDFGFGFEDKRNKISFSYDEANGDKYRRLNSWERNPDLSKKRLNIDKKGLYADYVPWTVSQYDIYDSRKLSTAFGEYKLTDSTAFKTGYDFTFAEKELNLENDPMREKVFGNSRWSQYNRFENIVYEKTREDRAYATLYTGLADLTFAGGQFEETVISREGLNTDKVLDYRTYKNNSDFYEFGIAKNNIGLGYLGEVSLFGNIRQDKYTDGINDGSNTENNDKSTRYQGGLTHKITLLDNSDNVNRWADIGLNNEFTLFWQDYKYDGDNKEQEYGRFINKENISKFGDKAAFEFGNTETVYTGEYTVKERPVNDEKQERYLKIKLIS